MDLKILLKVSKNFNEISNDFKDIKNEYSTKNYQEVFGDLNYFCDHHRGFLLPIGR